ncbi:response regulator [Spirosoma pollinicola]|nr:response regulator [Spirosoma pollinicola]
MNQNTYPCVFIADDDEDDRYLLNLAFARHSPQCRLVFAHDGLALLDALAHYEMVPELIILDMNMPRLNGFEALEALRDHPFYLTTPVVILTTSDAETDRQRAQQLGANEFITKPINSELLGQIVTRLRVDWLEGNCC